MKLRVQMCANATVPCFPLTWTLSPNLISVAPDMIRWYYSMVAQTHGLDYFIMPPSGTLYAYPGMMPAAVQAEYVEQQTYQAQIMNTTGSISWEWYAECWPVSSPLISVQVF